MSLLLHFMAEATTSGASLLPLLLPVAVGASPPLSCLEGDGACSGSGQSLLQSNKNLNLDHLTTFRYMKPALEAGSDIAGQAAIEIMGSGSFPAALMEQGAVNETLVDARTCGKYKEISKDIVNLVGNLSSECNDDSCPQGEFAGCVLRLAGHDFMDYNGDDFGGSDGCVDFEDPDNKGLKPCLVEGEGGVHLNDVFKKYHKEVSFADFLVIAAEAVMTRQRGDLTPRIEFHDGFVWGRITRTECPVNGGKQQALPNPDESCEANKKTFVQRLGLTWRQTAALMGVHTLGRARSEHSGFDGWWSDARSQQNFNNNYYLSMALKG